MSRSRLAVNLFSMGLWQAGNYLVPLLTLPYLSRALAPESFGIYSFSLAVMSAIAVVTEWGFPLCATRQMSLLDDDSGEVPGYIASVVSAKFSLFLLAMAVLAVLCWLAAPFAAAGLVLVAGVGIVLGMVFNLGWCLQGKERMGLFAVAATSARLLTLPAIFLLVHGPQDGWIAALIQSASALLAALVSIFFVHHLGYVKPARVTVADIRARLKDGAEFFLSSAAINLYTASSVVLLGLVRDPYAVALYAGADKIKSAAQNIISPISQVFFPRVVMRYKEDVESGNALVRKILLLFAVIGTGSSLCMFLFAHQIVALLLGAKFGDAVTILRILSPVPALSAISNVFSIQAMIPLGLARLRSRILVTITLCSAPLIAVMGYWMSGYGVACIIVLAELGGALAFAVVLAPHLKLRKHALEGLGALRRRSSMAGGKP